MTGSSTANVIVLCAFAALAGSGGATARPVAAAMLVSDDEARASSQAFAAHPEGPRGPATKALVLGAPTIEVVQPRMDMPAHPPFDVQVIAHPRDGLAIDRQSIRIRYGFFRVDITQRMLSLGHWQGDTFIVSHAAAPAGTHWFYVSVADTAHREGNAAVKVVVTES